MGHGTRRRLQGVRGGSIGQALHLGRALMQLGFQAISLKNGDNVQYTPLPYQAL